MKLAGILSGAATLLMLGGCAYDYIQRTDRVAFHAGESVKANMAIQTTNPSSAAQYSTKGLGKNGGVIGQPSTAAGGATE